MSVTTPTTAELTENIVAQISAELNQSIPLMPKSFVRVLAKALAGVVILLYKYAGFIALQMFVRTATLDETTLNGRVLRPLEEWGILAGAGSPAAAVRAELVVDVQVTDQTGSLASGTQLLNTDTGVTYLTLSSVPLDAATVQVTIRAVSDQQGGGGRGVIGNMEPGEELDFVSPPGAVRRTVTVDSQAVTGADGEAVEDYRQRIIQRFRQRPQGGAAADWQEWSVEPAGIIATYPYTGQPGTVDVYCEATEESSGSEDGIPTEAQLQEVENAVEFRQDGLPRRRPLNSYPNILPITRTGFDVTVAGLSADDPGAVELSIETACDEYFRGLEPYILGLSVLPRKDVISAPELGGIVQAVVAEAGGTFQSVTVEESGSEVLSRTLGEGEKAKLASITFVAGV